MRALLQRVTAAAVSINDREVARVGKGLVVLLGVSREDGEEDARYLVDKTVNLRIFPNGDSHFDRSALEVEAELLIVSQFTLYAGTRKGRRPDFTAAAPPEEAEPLYDRAVELFKGTGLRVETGRFRELMTVTIQNQGPVTLMLDSADRLQSRRA